MKIFPKKLKAGDEIRVIAPSRNLSIISSEVISLAKNRLENLELKVTFGKHISEQDLFQSSSIASRISDLHEAFENKEVKAILTVIGGYNSNQLLQYIDYNLIASNPKIFCGYSDITALQNAIFHKTGLITYSGPHFSSFGMKKGFEYCMDYFKKIFFETEVIEVHPSSLWSDDPWFIDQENRTFHNNEGHIILNAGTARGTLIGGSISTFQLLNGTEYAPILKDQILFLEGCAEYQNNPEEFDRQLQSIIYQKEFNKIKALLIGRFENKFSMTLDKLKHILFTKHELKNIPILANIDFGHTMPMFTFPIGGEIDIEAKNGKTRIQILKH